MLSFISSFLPYMSYCLKFCCSYYSFNHCLFASDIAFYFTSFFHVDFFLPVTLSISISRVSAVYVLLFCRKCCNSFFLFFYYLLDFSFFIAICYDTTSVLHIVFSVVHAIPVSINIPVFNVLTDSLNMFLKLFLVFY